MLDRARKSRPDKQIAVVLAKKEFEAWYLAILAGRFGLADGDLRLLVLAELTTTAWSVAGRDWVRRDGAGGRAALVDGVRAAFAAIPASLELRASP